VLRDGRTVGTLERGELSEQRLVELMTGDALETLNAVGEERRRTEPGRVTVRVEDLELRQGADRLSVAFRAGEVVGLAGLDGEGQAAFVRVLAGIERPAGGTVTALGEDGSQSEISGEKDAARGGVVYVPGDRKAEGILPNQTILENFGLPSYRDHAHAGLVSRRSVRRSLQREAGPLRLDESRAGDAITSLSGGNQQKVIIARWLARRPRVILLNDPTRGVDMITKKDLYVTLRDLAAEGTTVVFLSTEVEELTALCDRILVFRGQTLVGELAEDLAPKDVVAGMFGVRRAQEVEEVVAEATGEPAGPAEVRP
jgi:ribose transport system ATP-binding protein